MPHLCPWLLFIPLPCLQRLQIRHQFICLPLDSQRAPAAALQLHCSHSVFHATGVCAASFDYGLPFHVRSWFSVHFCCEFQFHSCSVSRRVLCSLVPLGRKCGLRPDHFTKFLHLKNANKNASLPEATTDTLAPATYSLGKYCQLHNRKPVAHPSCALVLMRMRTFLLTKRSSLYMRGPSLPVHIRCSVRRPRHGRRTGRTNRIAPMPSRTLLIPLQRVQTPPRMCLLPLPPFLQRATPAPPPFWRNSCLAAFVASRRQLHDIIAKAAQVLVIQVVVDLLHKDFPVPDSRSCVPRFALQLCGVDREDAAHSRSFTGA